MVNDRIKAALEAFFGCALKPATIDAYEASMSAALLAAEQAAPEDTGQILSELEKATQGKRCSCYGFDDYCPCQNVPDKITREARSPFPSAPTGAPENGFVDNSYGHYDPVIHKPAHSAPAGAPREPGGQVRSIEYEAVRIAAERQIALSLNGADDDGIALRAFHAIATPETVLAALAAPPAPTGDRWMPSKGARKTGSFLACTPSGGQFIVRWATGSECWLGQNGHEFRTPFVWMPLPAPHIEGGE